MNAEQIGAAYDTITSLWESTKFNRSNGVDAHRRAVAFTEQRGPALDIGCGCTGRFVDLMLDEGFCPEGIDVSERMLALAAKRHPTVCFHQADICEWELPRRYDFISAWDSIWHVALAKQEALLRKLIAALNSGGIFVFSCGGVDSPGEHEDDTMGPAVYYSSLGVSGFLKVIAESDCTCRHFEYDQYPEMHAFFIVQRN